MKTPLSQLTTQLVGRGSVPVVEIPRRRSNPYPEENEMPYKRQAQRSRFRGPGSRTRTMTKKRYPKTSTVTTQYDLAQRYNYKRMPRRKRRRWVSMLKKSQFIDQKSQPLFSWTTNYSQLRTANVNAQVSFGYLLYPVNAGNNLEERDLINIQDQAYTTGGVIDSARKFYVKSACLDVQIRNMGTAPVIIDCYRILCKLNNPTGAQTLSTLWANSFGEQSGGAGNTTKPALTPFQNPNFCRYFKILTKKEILLGALQTTTLQMRDPKNRIITGRQMISEQSILPYITKGFFFQVRGAPEKDLAGTGSQLAGVDLSVGIQKTYNWAYPPGPSGRDTISVNL